MRKGIVILIFGLVAAATVFCGVYYAETNVPRKVMRSDAPELLWLKNQFQLSDAEFNRISELHRNYLPGCEEMCRRIDRTNMQLQALLAANVMVTPEIDRKLQEASDLRAECQKRMLNHFYEVARTMPPQQGKRYLAWVQKKTFLSDYGMGK